MYIQFSDQLNAQTNSVGVWRRFSSRVTAWRQLLILQLHHRKATRLLAELDDRLLRDIRGTEASLHNPSGLTSQEPGVLAFNMQLLRAP